MTEDLNSKWTILQAQGSGFRSIFRVQNHKPPTYTARPCLVTITWNYVDADEDQLPTAAVQGELDNFEDVLCGLLDSVADMPVVVTGKGMGEWALYVTDFNTFIHAFNELMNDRPPVPIKITYSDDPTWNWWWMHAKHIQPEDSPPSKNG